jgi:hypothetical protein
VLARAFLCVLLRGRQGSLVVRALD